MERLTEKHYGANDYYMTCSEECAKDMDCIDCPSFDSLVDRLGAYENTGLTPEEVNDAVVGSKLLAKSKLASAFGVAAERLRELAEEYFGYHEEGYIYAQFFDDEQYINIPFDEFGKTAFLTLEEAEKALRSAEDA